MTQASSGTVLLVGPRVAHMKPHFEARGYSCDAFQTGGEAMLALMAKARDLIVLECQLGDQTAEEFVERAKASEPNAAYMLLDDISRAGLIAKAMQKGVHRYMPTPPNEGLLFKEAQGLIRAAKAMSGSLSESHDMEVRRLRAELERAQTDATEGELKVSVLREEIGQLQEQVGELSRRPPVDQLEKIRAERDDAKKELVSLKRRVEELTSTQIKQAGELAEMESLEKRAAELEQLEQKVVTLDERVFELHAELEDTKATLAETIGERDAAVSERDELRTRAESAERRRDELDAALGETTTALEAANRMVDDRTAALADTERAGTEASDRVGALIAEVELLRGQVEQLESGKSGLEEKSIDLELQLDELNTKISFLEDQLTQAERRVAETEAHFKKEKLRLIEEKQDAASGSHEAFQKMEKMIDELAHARTARAEAEAALAELKKGDG